MCVFVCVYMYVFECVLPDYGKGFPHDEKQPINWCCAVVHFCMKLRKEHAQKHFPLQAVIFHFFYFCMINKPVSNFLSTVCILASIYPGAHVSISPQDYSNLWCVCMWLDRIKMYSLDRKHYGRFLLFFLIFIFFFSPLAVPFQPQCWTLTPAPCVDFGCPRTLTLPCSNKYTVQDWREKVGRGQNRTREWHGKTKKERERRDRQMDEGKGRWRSVLDEI